MEESLAGHSPGGVASMAGNAAGQGYGMATGHQRCFDWYSLAASGTVGALSGGALLRPYTAPMQQVTSWAPRGTTPNLNPPRYVMTGGADLRNYALSGVPGRGYPMGNSTTATVAGPRLSYPSGADAFKGLIGQRVLW